VCEDFPGPIKNFCVQLFEVLPAPSGETLNAAAGSRLRELLQIVSSGAACCIASKFVEFVDAPDGPSSSGAHSPTGEA
jgi:hypothetical protein